MITIILPTVARPAMLRTALASIAGQTAVDKVSRIFVSENGGSRESEAVCAEFPSLPIQYAFRKPMTPIEHAQTLVSECLMGDLVAILHDDDWWVHTHLANAVQALEAHPHSSMYCSSTYDVMGESSMLKTSFTNFPWFGSNYAPFKPIWEMSRLNVLMAELLGTMCHFSTMVIRTEAFKKASYIFQLGNPYDNDRMLIFALSTLGSVLYAPLPNVFVRAHAGQDTHTYKSESQIRHMCETTRWLVGASGKSWDAVAHSFYQRLSLCPCEAYSFMLRFALEPWVTPELARNSNVSLERLKRRRAQEPLAAA